MTCARTRVLLAAYADGGLEGEEQGEVAAHVRACPACAEEVRVLREVLSDTRRLGTLPAPGHVPGHSNDEAFWNDLARDIRVAVAAERPRVSWWRLPAVTAAFALAAAALLWVVVKGQPQPQSPPATRPTTAAVEPPAAKPTPPKKYVVPETPDLEDLDDLDGDQLAAVAAALSPDEDGSASAPEPTEDELAVVSPAIAEAYLENLDDADLARVDTAL